MDRTVTLKFQLMSGEDDQNHRTVKLSGYEPVVVGRSSRDPTKSMASSPSNLHVANSVISRNHARITYQPDGEPTDEPYNSEWAVFIEDTDSSHGTFVNETQIIPEIKKEIKDGDKVRFGVSINRSDGCKYSSVCSLSNEADHQLLAVHLPPVYRVDIDNDGNEQGYESSHVGRSYSMPNESDGVDFDEYDEEDDLAPSVGGFYEEEEDDDVYGEEYDSDLADFPRDGAFSPLQSDDEQDVTEAPTSGQAAVVNESPILAPTLPKVRSLLTPEDESLLGGNLPLLPARTNSTFWDAVLEHPSAIPEIPSSPRVLQIRDLLSAAPPQLNRKRKFEEYEEDDDEEPRSIIPETLQSPPLTVASPGEDNDNDTTLVEEQTEAVARLLKEPSEEDLLEELIGKKGKKVRLQKQSESQRPDTHRSKRSRLADVAFGVGLFVAGSASAVAALAILPDGFFA
jgi:hypothetical protein